MRSFLRRLVSQGGGVATWRWMAGGVQKKEIQGNHLAEKEGVPNKRNRIPQGGLIKPEVYEGVIQEKREDALPFGYIFPPLGCKGNRFHYWKYIYIYI